MPEQTFNEAVRGYVARDIRRTHNKNFCDPLAPDEVYEPVDAYLNGLTNVELVELVSLVIEDYHRA